MLCPKDKETINSISRRNVSAKTTNKEIFLNMQIIDEAIAEHRKITFRYFKYRFDKKLSLYEINYKITPLRHAFYDDRYYIIGLNDKGIFRHYHISKIKCIEKTDEIAMPTPNQFSLNEYINNSTMMYSGEAKMFKLRFRTWLLDEIVMQFGENTAIRPDSSEGFLIADVKGTQQGMFYWALRYIDSCEILSPPELRRNITETLKNSPYLEV